MTSKLARWSLAACHAENFLRLFLEHPEIAKKLDRSEVLQALEGLSQSRIEMLADCGGTQPAAGEPIGKVELFGINMTYVEWRDRKMPPLGTELYTAPPAAAPVAAGEPVADAKQLAASLNLVRSWERPGQATEWEFEVPGSFNRHVVAASEQIARAIVAQDIRREAPPAAAHGDDPTPHFRFEDRAGNAEWYVRLNDHRAALATQPDSVEAELTNAREQMKFKDEAIEALRRTVDALPDYIPDTSGCWVKMGDEYGDGWNACLARIEAMRAEIEQEFQISEQAREYVLTENQRIALAAKLAVRGAEHE